MHTSLVNLYIANAIRAMCEPCIHIVIDIVVAHRLAFRLHLVRTLTLTSTATTYHLNHHNRHYHHVHLIHHHSCLQKPFLLSQHIRPHCCCQFGFGDLGLGLSSMKRQPVLEWQAKHGGVRQRRAAVAGTSSRDFRPYSKLVELCLEMWAYEELSAIKFQKIMNAAKEDGLGDHPTVHSVRDEINKFAGIGDFGKHPGNCSRDLHRAMNFDDITSFDAIDVLVPYKTPELVLEYMKVPVICPHIVVSVLAEHYPSEFERCFGSVADLVCFWEQQDTRDPKLAQHPVVAVDDYKRRAFPVKIHSDKVVMTKKDSLHVMNWSSMLGHSEQAQYLAFMFASMVASCCARDDEDGDDTIKVLSRVWAWSFTWCLLGIHPTTDWTGAPWSAGSKEASLAGQPLATVSDVTIVLAVLGLCADLEELCNQYKLRHFNSLGPCFLCRATAHDLVGGCPWTDFAPRALWRRTKEALPLDGSAVGPPNDHPIWTIPGLTVFCVMFDILHTLDLGVAAHVVGSCLEEFTKDARLGHSQESRMAVVWTRIRELYKEGRVETRLGNLKLSMFRSTTTSFACISAKGNETRHMVPVILKLCEEYHDPENAHHVHRLAAVTYLVRYYGIVSRNEFVLPPEQRLIAQESISEFLKHYVWLSDASVRAGNLTWQQTIKLHYFDHSSDQLMYMNPKKTSTYMFESFVGKLAKVGRAASYGKPPATLVLWLHERVATAWRVRFRKLAWSRG